MYINSNLRRTDPSSFIKFLKTEKKKVFTLFTFSSLFSLSQGTSGYEVKREKIKDAEVCAPV